MGHHQKADRLEPDLTCKSEMLLRNIGFGAMCRDTNYCAAQICASLDIVFSADAGQYESGDAPPERQSALQRQ